MVLRVDRVMGSVLYRPLANLSIHEDELVLFEEREQDRDARFCPSEADLLPFESEFKWTGLVRFLHHIQYSIVISEMKAYWESGGEQDPNETLVEKFAQLREFECKKANQEHSFESELFTSIGLCSSTNRSTRPDEDEVFFDFEDAGSFALKSTALIKNEFLRVPKFTLKSNRFGQPLHCVADDTELTLLWSPGLHLLLHEAALVTRCFGRKSQPRTRVNSFTFDVELSLPKGVRIFFNLASKEHQINLQIGELRVKWPKAGLVLLEAACDRIAAFFDGREIVTLEKVLHQREAPSPTHRSALEIQKMSTNSNHTLIFSFDRCHACFPYGYNFYACYYDALTTRKFVKQLHSGELRSFYEFLNITPPEAPQKPVEPSLNSDLIFEFKRFAVEVKDDPYECKLIDDFLILLDEAAEHEKHRELLQNRIEKNPKLSRPRYVKRITKWYEGAAGKLTDHLFIWEMCNVRLVSLADESLLSREQIFDQIKSLDPVSTWPEDLDPKQTFSQLWLRIIQLNAGSIKFQLRDYARPIMDISDILVWGKFGSSEAAPSWQSGKEVKITLSKPWPDFTLSRYTSPHKWYYDLNAGKHLLLATH
ncbi:hypothetical protein Ciccas_004934 [Cichlidogyrus casuarinus]|uniref:Uncharacterized protein n=1 Tax=Cichlidogyrus casuarinus TaxID=1844966 RepID=A0ABD2QB07_9PLAT